MDRRETFGWCESLQNVVILVAVAGTAEEVLPMKKGLLFCITLFLLLIVNAGCGEMSEAEFRTTLAPMKEKLNEALVEMESVIEEFLPQITPVLPEVEPLEPGVIDAPEVTVTSTAEPTPEPTATSMPMATNTPTLSSMCTPKPTPTSTPINTPIPTLNPVFCEHMYELAGIRKIATDYAPGVRRYVCKQCGQAVERSYALPQSVDTGNGQATTVYGYWDLEKSAEMLRLLNKWRTENGVSEVQDGNNGTARQRALECAYYYSHTRPNGERCFSAYEAYGMFAMAENIAAGYGNPEAVTKGWINSTGHNKNMLNPEYGHAVVSMFVVVDDALMGEVSALKESTYQYKNYYVQNFWK